jgi:choline-sulfatase
VILAPMAGFGAGEPPPVHRQPNFLVVVADDQCFRSIRALNNPEVHTPSLDRLVARGTAFTHCFHQGSWTGAVCVASRAMMHTGRFLWTCGGDQCGDHPLLGETLQQAGYETCVVGKWHNGDQTALRSFATGKTIGPGFYASTPVDGLAYNRPRPGDAWTPWDPQYAGQWTPTQLWDIERPPASGPGQRTGKAGARYERHQHSCELYADSVVALLRQAAARPEHPFFLYLAWNAPHDPRQAPREFLDMYPEDQIEVPPNFLPQHPFDQGDFKVRDEKLAPFPRTPEAVRLHRREYYALLSYMDRQLGRILDALEQTGQAGNTHVIVTGDHGLAVGEHGLLGKQNLYDCSVRMPFIVAGPGIAAGRRIDSLMYQHCLFPTMCDLAGVATPASVQFPSLLPLLRGARKPLFDSLYCAYRGFQRMVRTDKYKLILYPEARRYQLFDLEQDPWEITSLDAASHRATVAELLGALKQWQERVQDKLELHPSACGLPV